MAAKLVVALGSIALNALLTRLLSPDEVGAYFLVVSVVTVGALLVLLGIHQAIVPVIASCLESHDPSRVGIYIRTAFLCLFLATILVAGIYWQIGGEWLGKVVFESPHVAAVGGLTAIWIGLRGLQTLGSEVLRGFHRIGLASVFEGALTSVLIVVIFAAVLVWKGTSSLAEVLILSVCVLAMTSIMNIYSIRVICRKVGCKRGYDIYELLRASFPLFVVSIAVPGIAEAHLWILGQSTSDAEVAIYGAAYRVARVVVIPLLIVNSVIPPMISQLMAQGRLVEVERVLRLTAFVAGVPSILIVFLLIVEGDRLLGMMFGEYYARGSGVLVALVVGQAVNVLTGSPGVLLVASGRQFIVMRIAIISGFIGILLSIILVDGFGASGIAYGVATGLVVHNVIMWAYCWHTMRIRTHMRMVHLGDIFDVLSLGGWLKKK